MWYNDQRISSYIFKYGSTPFAIISLTNQYIQSGTKKKMIYYPSLNITILSGPLILLWPNPKSKEKNRKAKMVMFFFFLINHFITLIY